MIGNIHSIESFATLDGGGIRFGLFMQGCPLRCAYCHNPDTQSAEENTLIDSDKILEKIARNKAYYVNGGVTITGGEPLMQSDFVVDLAQKIHSSLALEVALDTSFAIIPSNIDDIIANIDLFIVDLKFFTEEMYLKYSGGSLARVLQALALLEKNNKRVLLRTVIVPTINDSEECIDKYVALIKDFRCIEEYQLLAYHTLGVYKYEKLHRKYSLEGIAPLAQDRRESLQQYLDNTMAKHKIKQ